jgi:hypothetical protein
LILNLLPRASAFVTSRRARVASADINKFHQLVLIFFPTRRRLHNKHQAKTMQSGPNVRVRCELLLLLLLLLDSITRSNSETLDILSVATALAARWL